MTTGKVISCRAAVAWGPGQPLIMEKVQVDPPQKMEVRIKILFTSICHTDLSAWLGEKCPYIANLGIIHQVLLCLQNETQRVHPRILRHEAAGIVESVGEGVMDMKEGDHVVPIFNGECGECVYCKCEKTNLCEKYRVNPFKSVMVNDGRTRFSTNKEGKKKPIFHFLNTSTFSKCTVLDSACVVKIDSNAPLKNMTLLSCGEFILAQRMIPLHPMELFDGRKIVGSVFGDFKGKTQLPHFAKQCMRGVVNLDEFITHELPFDKINEAVQLLVDGKSLRCLLHL
ncbi:hypothetical protein CsSME_00045297 [Camellia sinensis var. sinensis]